LRREPSGGEQDAAREFVRITVMHIHYSWNDPTSMA
jgi:hypothetical protein